MIVNPSFVLGPDEPKGSSMELIRRFLLGRIPVYVAGGLNIVDVRDVAQGHLLADQKGEVGERYILAGRNFTLDRLFADLARISGRDHVPVKLPATPTALAVELAERVGLPLPVFGDEVRSANCWWTYRNTKARKELGFEPRPHEETLEDAVRWQMERARRAGSNRRGPQEAALAAVGRCCASESGCSTDERGQDRALPLPDAHQRAVPVRRRGEAAREPRARVPHRAAAVPAREAGPRSRS